MDINLLLSQDGKSCACGKTHYALLEKAIIGKNAVDSILDVVKSYNAKSVFMIFDLNTYKVGGERVKSILEKGGIKVNSYLFDTITPIAPDEKAVGDAIMHYKPSDMIVTVGSGVLNDIGKIVAKVSEKPYCIVATAPSMDGYASGSSSMELHGHKSTVQTKCPNVVIGDSEILKNAPIDMLYSGVGDIIAKYVSICEWKISNIITGEYYCEKIANMMQQAVKEVVSSAPALIDRDEKAVESVMSALVFAGIAMNYAQITRPASGIEHYFSHIWDMRGLAFGEKVYFHGIQCGVSTVETLKYYEYLSSLTPNREKAINYAQNFDENEHNQKMFDFIGEGAKAMIALNQKENKYDIIKHAQRLQVIIDKWEQIKKVMQELPTSQDLQELFKSIGAPSSMQELNKSNLEIAKTFNFTKDIRDKYVASKLCWDLGVIEDIISTFYGVKI